MMQAAIDHGGGDRRRQAREREQKGARETTQGPLREREVARGARDSGCQPAAGLPSRISTTEGDPLNRSGRRPDGTGPDRTQEGGGRLTELPVAVALDLLR